MGEIKLRRLADEGLLLNKIFFESKISLICRNKARLLLVCNVRNSPNFYETWLKTLWFRVAELLCQPRPQGFLCPILKVKFLADFLSYP